MRVSRSNPAPSFVCLRWLREHNGNTSSPQTQYKLLSYSVTGFFRIVLNFDISVFFPFHLLNYVIQ